MMLKDLLPEMWLACLFFGKKGNNKARFLKKKTKKLPKCQDRRVFMLLSQEDLSIPPTINSGCMNMSNVKFYTEMPYICNQDGNMYSSSLKRSYMVITAISKKNMREQMNRFFSYLDSSCQRFVSMLSMKNRCGYIIFQEYDQRIVYTMPIHGQLKEICFPYKENKQLVEDWYSANALRINLRFLKIQSLNINGLVYYISNNNNYFKLETSTNEEGLVLTKSKFNFKRTSNFRKVHCIGNNDCYIMLKTSTNREGKVFAKFKFVSKSSSNFKRVHYIGNNDNYIILETNREDMVWARLKLNFKSTSIFRKNTYNSTLLTYSNRLQHRKLDTGAISPQQSLTTRENKQEAITPQPSTSFLLPRTSVQPDQDDQENALLYNMCKKSQVVPFDYIDKDFGDGKRW